MAAVPVTIVGILTTESGSTNATMVGMASLTGLGVGGGPVLPGDGGKPPGPWGPNDPRPTPPIANVPGIDNPDPPGKPEVPPPSIWPPGPGIDFPSHPIVIPPPVGPGTPIPPGTLINWEAVWSPENGWEVIGKPNVPHPSPS